jgi:hypothetical protein
MLPDILCMYWNNSRLFRRFGDIANISRKFSRLFAQIMAEAPFDQKYTGENPFHQTGKSNPLKCGGDFPVHTDR